MSCILAGETSLIIDHPLIRRSPLTNSIFLLVRRMQCLCLIYSTPKPSTIIVITLFLLVSCVGGWHKELHSLELIFLLVLLPVKYCIMRRGLLRVSQQVTLESVKLGNLKTTSKEELKLRPNKQYLLKVVVDHCLKRL